jgi:hypothetical protein
VIVPGASWCDLVKHADGRVEFVYLQGTTVVCESAQTGARRWAVNAGRALLYLRAAADVDGRVCAIGQGHDDGQAWMTIDGAKPVSLGTTHGVFPVLITTDENGWVAFVQYASDEYIRHERWRNGALITIPSKMPPTSQGFLYVASNGQPITQDQGRGAIPGLALPSPAPSDVTVWVGQSMDAPTLALFDSETGAITPLGTPGGQPPHLVESGGTYYVCSYVEGGAWLSTHRRPFAAAQPGPPDPPPVTPPVEPPKETPVQLESKHSNLIQAFADQFGLPGFSKEDGQAWVAKLASTMKARFPGEGWGTKRASMGRPLSNESVARPVNGRLWGYDLIIGAGAPGQRLEPQAHPEDITDQVFVEVESRDWLGSPTDPGTPKPPVTPPPPAPGRPFPAPRWPEDVFLHALTRYINEALYLRDKPEENPGGSRTASRGALMWFVPIATEELIADIVAHGNQAPTPERWWALADRVAVKAIDFYRRTAPPE